MRLLKSGIAVMVFGAVLLLPLLLSLVSSSKAALPVVQKAALASLECGCTTKAAEGGYRVVVKSVSKSWQRDGKKCRTLRITVFEGDDLVYNGIQKVCQP